MSKDLYNEFRPRKFSDMFKTSDIVSIQPQIAATLNNEKQGGIGHGLLFLSDHPGLGKTTAARIIASELNPMLTDEERTKIFEGRENPVCFELNIADLRKIDDARQLDAQVSELRDSMHPYNYVFILDELHKMIDQAQDVLLKTIENAPPNVYIICTATSISTIMPALVSRLELHRFYPLTRQLTSNLLLDICKGADYSVTPDSRVLDTIYEVCRGMPRASIVALANYMKNGTLPERMTEEESVAVVGSFITSMANDIRGVVEKTSRSTWKSHLAPVAFGLTRQHSVAELRVQILLRLGRLVTEKAAAPVAKFYYELTEEFKNPFQGPPEVSLFVLKLYQVYVRSIGIIDRLPASEDEEK